MKDLSSSIHQLKKTPTHKEIITRLAKFEKLNNSSSKSWFSELCFCILTANSKAKTAVSIQNELGYAGFSRLTHKQLSDRIRKNKHRFHNNKAKYIIEARKNSNIKTKVRSLIKIGGVLSARNWLAENIKGIGYKEASHFMRNIGFLDVAILDRHIVNLMLEHGLITEKPRYLNRKAYLSIEKTFNSLARKMKMKPGELDMYMWYLKTGEVLK